MKPIMLGEITFLRNVNEEVSPMRGVERFLYNVFEYCKMSIHNGKFKRNIDGTPREEKQTDVKLALQVITDIMLKKYEKIIILSNDTDFVPLIQYIKDINIHHGIKTEIIFLIPPGAEPNKDIKNQLLSFYDIDVKTENYKIIENLKNQ
jgi:uncharacterized LabA/DUF88 family protein